MLLLSFQDITAYLTTNFHMFLQFCFLMAEAIMCHYNNNVLTMNYKRNTKTTIHWILQVLGGGCGIAGVLIKCIKDDFYLFNLHTKLGKRERAKESKI